ncbi:MAG: HYExAFE family protein [Phycisphaeraceae bacterium]|nr:HYExAFE family protein [Phycisphaeraceae bacterium]
MGQSRIHYEAALASLLRWRGIPYVSINEARRTLLPVVARRINGHQDPRPGSHSDTGCSTRGDTRAPRRGGWCHADAFRGMPGPELPDDRPRGTDDALVEPLKSFDFVAYRPEGRGANLLLDVKGRKCAFRGRGGGRGRGRGTLQCWVTLDDVTSLGRWIELFGAGFDAAFVFVYLCDRQPADGFFPETFVHRGRWYGLACVPVEAYARKMRRRSARWATVDLAAADFEQLAGPLMPAGIRASGQLEGQGHDWGNTVRNLGVGSLTQI